MKAMATHSATREAPLAVSAGREDRIFSCRGSEPSQTWTTAAVAGICYASVFSIGSSHRILIKFSPKSSANGANPWPISLH